jgi:ankyrin repeat protein
MSNNLEAVKILIRRGALIDPIDHLGNTPLIYATEMKNKEMIRLLDEQGADGRKKNFEGLSAYYIGLNSDNEDIRYYYLGNYKYLSGNTKQSRF